MVIPEIRPFPESDITNVWNHTQIQGDGINVTSAYDPRTIQLAMKVSF
jgi:hypothetical protein